MKNFGFTAEHIFYIYIDNSCEINQKKQFAINTIRTVTDEHFSQFITWIFFMATDELTPCDHDSIR